MEHKNSTTDKIKFTMSSIQSQITRARVCAQSCLTLCNTMDCSLPGSYVHGISRQEYWSGLPFPSPGDLPDSGIEPTSLVSPALAGKFLTTRATWEAQMSRPSGYLQFWVCYSKIVAYCPSTHLEMWKEFFGGGTNHSTLIRPCYL